MRDLITYNGALRIWMSGGGSLEEGAEKARGALDSGAVGGPVEGSDRR